MTCGMKAGNTPKGGQEADEQPRKGQCIDDVLALSRVPKIAKQLAKVDPEVLRGELREYGAWDAAELADHDANLERLLWLAAGDITEENVSK